MSRSVFLHRRGGLRYVSEVMADSPIVYWRLNESSGTSAADYTGHGHTGVYTADSGTVVLAQPTPLNSDPSDQSIIFSTAPSGGTPHVIAAASTAWDTSSMSIEAWIHPTSGQSSKHGIASVMDDGSLGFTRWYVRIQPGTGNIEIFNETAVGTTANVSFNVWTYLVVTFTASDSSWRVYLNGTLASTTGSSSLGARTNRQFTIGHNNSDGAGSERFVGGMDEVALYGSALSADRIAVHYNAAF